MATFQGWRRYTYKGKEERKDPNKIEITYTYRGNKITLTRNLDDMQERILFEITRRYPYSIETVRSLYRSFNSYDKVISIIDDASGKGIHPFDSFGGHMHRFSDFINRFDIQDILWDDEYNKYNPATTEGKESDPDVLDAAINAFKNARKNKY